MVSEVRSDWPSWALLPKRETNVINFLTKYPEFDGRGIKIAVLDSGIDPGAPGLQQTSNGKVKIVEMMDASGAGDVDTSTIVEAIDDVIIGLSGRKLKIPSSWRNPSNKYHIGLKASFELYAKPLRERICKEQKEKDWDPQHKILTAEALREIQEFNAANSNSVSPLPLAKKLQREEIETTADVLSSLEKKHNNIGPSYDCIVFHDGEMWRAVVDASENGDLESCTLLGPYSLTHQYATLTSSDMLNYSVNIHDEGNLLEIVSISTAHGTHVASIAAAYFPDDPEKNGIAPGAQIVSVCIGDIRLNSMETGAALMRAFVKVIESNCDVINMSYGEHANWTGGRVMDMIHEVVNKHGVIMISSAGNNGPALTTVGTPPCMPSSSVIGVGAYVSPDMMCAEYSLREKAPGMGYTWTSRGPGLDGDLGVSISAPGGAITSVPNWLLRGSQLMNGTSMSAPHVSGCVGILLSGLKAKHIPYSPYSVRRSIQHTALKVNSWDAFSMGHGLVQVDKAFEHLEAYSQCIARNVRISVSVGNKKGIYLREVFKTNRPHTAVIVIEPLFLDAMNADNEKKIAFNMNLNLVCDVPWVSIPSHLNLMYTARSISTRIDPRGLPPGEHFTWIQAFDSECPEKGAIFEIPVTVIKPIVVDESTNYELKYQAASLQPRKVLRHFIDVPHGATYAFFRIRSQDTLNDASVVIHAIQLRPQSSCKMYEFHKMLRLAPKEESVCVFNLQEKRVLEVAIAKWWANHDSLMIDYTISFHGLKPNLSQINMHAADMIQRVDVCSLLKHEELSPSVALKFYVMTMRPSEHKISPLKRRDVIPVGRQIYEIQLTYNFALHTKSTDVTPICSMLSELLYESEYESQLWMLFDCNKQLLACGDAYPSKYSVKLDKGEYVVKLQIRHEQRSLLEKMTDLPMLIQTKLPATLNLDVYDKHSLALTSGKKVNWMTVHPGITVPLFITPLSCDKLPKNSLPGHYLLGNISFAKDEAVKKVDLYPFKYIINDIPAKKSSSSKNSSEKDKEKSSEEEYQDAFRDLKTSWISKGDDKLSRELFDSVMSSDPNHIPAIQARLQNLEERFISLKNAKAVEKCASDCVKLENSVKTCQVQLSEQTTEDKTKDMIACNLEMIQLADKILSSINTMEVLAFQGSRSDKKENPNSKSLEKQKAAIIDALVKKGVALCNLAMKGVENIKNGIAESKAAEGDIQSNSSNFVEISAATDSASPPKTTLSEANLVYTELQKWIELSDSKVSIFIEHYALAHCHFARAAKLYLKHLEEKPSLEIEKKCITMFKKLGWNHAAQFFEGSLLVKYPLSYRLF